MTDVSARPTSGSGAAEGSAAPAAPARETSPRDRAVIRLLLVAAFVVILNETVMGVAIPHLMGDLGITATAAQWLTTGFLLTMAVVIPVTGFLLQRVRSRVLYLTAMSLFTAGTALAVVAPGFGTLLVARVIQASGTAIMMPLLITTVMTLVPPAVRGRTMGNISVVIAVAPAIGPTISGLVLEHLSWRFLFVVVLPVAVAVLVLGARRMRDVTEPRATRLDVLSVVLSAVGFGGLVYGLSHLGEGGGSGVAVSAASISAGVVVTGLFVLRQLRLQRRADDGTRPGVLLDLRTFRTPVFAVSVVMFVVSMMALFGTIILLPLLMQTVLGLSVLTSGLLLLPGGLVMGLAAPHVGRAYDRVGPRPLLVPGTALVAAVLWTMTVVVSTTTPWWLLLALHVALSAGLALVFTPLFTASLGSLPPHLYSHGSAVVSTVQQVAAAAGIALFVATMTAVAASGVADGADPVAATADGIATALLIGAVVASLAVVTAFFVRGGSQPDGERVVAAH